mgnify:FL=1
MLKIAICDDEKIFRDNINKYVAAYLNEKEISYEIDTFSSGKEIIDLGIEIKQYDIIYDAIEDIERAMRGMRAPKYRDVDTGEVEVREVYKISSAGTIAGSLVTSGTIKRDGKVRVIRNGKQIADVKLANLKRFKDEVKEVSSGYECGISLDGWDDIQAGDILQAYVVEEYRD